ncbi:aldehyde dehydrogenase family protein [Streptomyces sp. NPDC058762]|uniref:aldehyde dehydrogenase family protein n=1 Tax=Streptomyces sp. NPDC058762 TaxID=3346629 RepID=UPI00369B34E8
MPNTAKQVLELGGSDPFVVLADADVEAAAVTAVKARHGNVGQSCVNAKRFIVEEAVADAFVPAFTAAAAKQKVGDPTDPETTIGPMARANLRDTLHDQVRRIVDAGAHLLLGGEIPDGPGCYYPPTVLDHAPPGRPPSTRRPSAPSPPSPVSPTPTRPSPRPTGRSTASAPPCGPVTSTEPAV